MNKMILQEALSNGLKLENNSVVYNSIKVNINLSLYEVSKLHFSLPISSAINKCKETLFADTGSKLNC